MKTFVLLCLFTCAFGLSSYGTDFYFGALRNYQGQIRSLYLYIMTHSSSPVNVTIEDYNRSVIATGSVTNMTLMKLSLSTDLVTVSNNYNNRHKGIRVYTNGGVVSVLLVNYRYSGSVGEYLAYPVKQLSREQYQYYAVSTGSLVTNALSEVLLVGTDDNTAVTVIPTKNITIPQDIQMSSSLNMTVTAGTLFSFTLHRMQTFLIGSQQGDITGTSITSDKPLTVISGHECGNVPDNVKYCEHITVQVPPTAEWGKQFLLSPYSERPVQYYKVIAMEGQTKLNFTCGTDVTTISLSGGGNFHTLYTQIDNYCSIVSNKPILVIQLGPGYNFGNIGDPVISYIPSIDQFTKLTVYISLNIQNVFTSHYINIVATSQDTVLLDGTPLSLSWNTIYDDTSNFTGYGAQVQVNTTDTPHVITTQSDTKFYVLVYGFDSLGVGYSYSVGVNNDVVKSCLVNNGNCEHLCTQVGASVNCSCMSGYQVINETHCIDINECSTNNNGGCEQLCHNTNGSYNCSCNNGYVINPDHYRCDDINECLSFTGCNQYCTNTNGSFSCYCMNGYHLTSDNETCADTNECLISNGGCNQICTNTIGSYQCSCNIGYQLHNGNTCIDIDECTNGTNYCEHNCYNTNGSYFCDCQPGYQLSNEFTCSDINECTLGTSGCTQGCINTVGSYRCTCEDGYYMGSDGYTCLDIDECTQRNDTNCQQKCVNDDGSFHCECDQPGYKLSVTNGSDCIKDTSINDIYYYIIPVAVVTTVFIIITTAVVIAIGVVIVVVKRMKKKSNDFTVPPHNDIHIDDFDNPIYEMHYDYIKQY